MSPRVALPERRATSLRIDRQITLGAAPGFVPA